ncbi:hypothetical protein Bbelb_336930 [Branchiostoma belcheri]|nr:hypothetical protein Bbelb_336930 [Branchiostoma belcheri]
MASRRRFIQSRGNGRDARPSKWANLPSTAECFKHFETFGWHSQTPADLALDLLQPWSGGDRSLYQASGGRVVSVGDDRTDDVAVLNCLVVDGITTQAEQILAGADWVYRLQGPDLWKA